jgi:hypothetical protein
MFTIHRNWDCPGPSIGEDHVVAQADDVAGLPDAIREAFWRDGTYRIERDGQHVVRVQLVDGVPVADEFVDRLVDLADRHLAA